MLNAFPNFLTYGIFAPTLLRVVVALVFAYLAYTHYQRRGELSLSLGIWVWVAIVLEAVVALGLFFGAHTQIAALIGIFLAVPQLMYAKQHTRAVPMCRLEYALIIVILVSLVLTGAGQPAFDIHL